MNLPSIFLGQKALKEERGYADYGDRVYIQQFRFGLSWFTVGNYMYFKCWENAYNLYCCVICNITNLTPPQILIQRKPGIVFGDGSGEGKKEELSKLELDQTLYSESIEHPADLLSDPWNKSEKLKLWTEPLLWSKLPQVSKEIQQAKMKEFILWIESLSSVSQDAIGEFAQIEDYIFVRQKRREDAKKVIASQWSPGWQESALNGNKNLGVLSKLISLVYRFFTVQQMLDF